MFRLALWFIFLAIASRHLFGSTLSNTVAQMSVGTWALITPANKSAIAGINTANLADSGCWDPVNHKFMMVGSDHAASYNFPTYTDATNAWTAGPAIVGVPYNTSFVGHAFDGNTTDRLGNCYYRIRRGTGGSNADIFKFNVASNTWTALPPNPLASSGEYTNCCQGIAYFTEMNSLIWVTQGTGSGAKVYRFNVTTSAWSLLGTASPYGGGTWNFVEYNPVRQILIFASASGGFYKMNSAGTITALAAPPANVFYTGSAWPGIVTVDPVSGVFIVLSAETRACRTYEVNTDTWGTCTNPPAAIVSNGFSGSPMQEYGAIIFHDSGPTTGTTRGDIYVYKHSAQSADQSFASRCAAAGVLKCVGFDSASQIPVGITTGGVFTSVGGTTPTLDSAIKVSGASSLRITMPASEGSDAGGWYQSNLGGTNFGPGSRFFIQFKYRMQPGMLVPSNGGGGNKQVIIYSQEGGSCANVEVTTNNAFWRGYPQMYTACGAGILYDNLGNGDFLLQNGKEDPRFECHYQSPTERAPYPCGVFHTDEWTTLYYDITVGNPWGSATSTIRGYYAYDGQPMRQFQYKTNYTINQGSSTFGFNRVMLTGYDTNRTSHSTTNTIWFDELIISTQPIAPGSGSVDTTAPAAPTGVIVR